MPAFSRLPDHELDRLDDDELIAYLRAAQRAGDRHAADRSLAVLVYGHWSNVERRVRLKVPQQHVEDVTGDIIVSAIRAAFDGTSEGEFHVWLGTITQRRIADFHRRAAARPAATSLDCDPEDGGPSVGAAAPSEAGYVEVQDAIERVLRQLREDHRRVVEMLVFDGYGAADAVAEIAGMTEASAFQIVSRFRKALRRELEGDTASESP